MNQYLTGTIIKKRREEKNITQAEFAALLGVSDKAVSKWETGRGFPDICLLKPIAETLGISVSELLNGEEIRNHNRAFNMRKVKFYCCPLCGNVIVGTGEAVISCCGIDLLPREAEAPDAEHDVTLTEIEDEYVIGLAHPMTKDHYISFIAVVKDSGYELVKLYPEGSAEARFKKSCVRLIYYYCNHHGLFMHKVPPAAPKRHERPLFLK